MEHKKNIQGMHKEVGINYSVYISQWLSNYIELQKIKPNFWIRDLSEFKLLTILGDEIGLEGTALKWCEFFLTKINKD